MIGSYGDIVFEVSSERVKTFRDFQIQRSAKYSEHAIHGRKALLEFTGLSPASLSINIRLDAGLGLNPKEELNMLYEVLNNHITMPFILDGEPQGDNLWVLESIDEKREIIDNHGTLIAAEITLKLKEYIEVNNGA
ncbi:MAG: phage tail protein [Synergistaceae bacterium]|nr:phage tail protein [Synergistaceae bacterium]MBQ3449574.1 phage tail protein [Synergistaceae bacterium]MBQ3694241.1 phage tail protein [Synergistaceae bacterium]MBQ9628878.1 phage tail protein [Synergistaceae bacterium]